MQHISHAEIRSPGDLHGHVYPATLQTDKNSADIAPTASLPDSVKDQSILIGTDVAGQTQVCQVSPAANSAKTQKVGDGSSTSGARGTKRPEEERFQEVHNPLFQRETFRQILEWQKGLTTGPGLDNLSNTCFCNAVLQCLTYTAPLANFCLCSEHSTRIGKEADNGKYDTLLAVQQHVVNAFACKNKVMRPTSIIDNLKQIGPDLKRGQQHDAHEFARLFMDGMHIADLEAYRFSGRSTSRHAQTGAIYVFWGDTSATKCTV